MDKQTKKQTDIQKQINKHAEYFKLSIEKKLPRQ